MNIDDMIEVLQAYKEGKSIEVMGLTSGQWFQSLEPSFCFRDFNYRVKPEPKEYYLKIGSDGDVMDGIVACSRDRYLTWSEGSRVIKVKEIIE